jgi:hypothetical protein
MNPGLTRETPDAKNIAAAAIADKKNASPFAAFASRRTFDHNISFGPAGKLIGSFSLLAGLLLAGSASANPTTTVSVGGNNYNVTYVNTSYVSNPSYFSPAYMPWWGDGASARSFVSAITSSLGTHNFLSYPPGGTSPLFANQTLGSRVGFYAYNPGLAIPPMSGLFGSTTSDAFVLDYAIAYLIPSAPAFSSQTLQPYASNQSIGLDALKNQRELVLNEAGECDRRGWVVYDSDKNQPQAKTKKHQSLCIFAEGGNATGAINGTGSLGGYNTANASSAYGLEWKASKQWTIGAAYGYGSTNLSNFNFQDTSANIGSTINSGALYGVYRPDKQQRWKIAGLFGYSGFSYTGSRSYLGDVATSAYNASGYTGALQASYDIPLTTDYNGEKNRLSPVRIKPMLGLAYGSQQQDGFSESGAGTLVNVQGQTTNSLLGNVGVSLEAPIALNQKKTTVLIPKIGVAYQYDFLADQDGNRSITASLQDDATTSYTVQGQNRGSSNLQLNLGADLQLNPKTVLYAGVNYQAFNTGDQFGYQGGLRYKF